MYLLFYPQGQIFKAGGKKKKKNLLPLGFALNIDLVKSCFTKLLTGSCTKELDLLSSDKGMVDPADMDDCMILWTTSLTGS